MLTYPQLRLITTNEEVPQLYKPQDTPVFPESLIKLTDNLHDADMVELGQQILDQYTKLERLIAFSRYVLEVAPS